MCILHERGIARLCRAADAAPEAESRLAIPCFIVASLFEIEDGPGYAVQDGGDAPDDQIANFMFVQGLEHVP